MFEFSPMYLIFFSFLRKIRYFRNTLTGVHVPLLHCDVDFCGDHAKESNTPIEDALLADVRGRPDRLLCKYFIVPSVSNLSRKGYIQDSSNSGFSGGFTPLKSPFLVLLQESVSPGASINTFPE
ncbi:hypothetical protein TNCV_2618161 [Trichonephila clavipes]|nr:hypothetical protein TNCV_2618161 [Trichonephila clavipes]